jgi:hypothetical protein
VRDRLALDGKKAGGYFNQQIVEPVQGKNGPLGYLRLTSIPIPCRPKPNRWIIPPIFYA